MGLNGTDSLPSIIPRNRVVEMDWWEEREITVEGKGKVKVTCSKCQLKKRMGSCAEM